ncbi:Bug family tripartite tricarboxylate transporter substrate binding protein [Rhodobium gokarnense]|uniref:Tripartite-type tricarboxylate transporter receptor subunit TctC n=1 Tax=Rhodobium gokarnense TaxID=364296 RepID=A0ABT3H615_9HYPH|nr:tripartite tricarboxylate transporter substrate binding protein [Rhodobium gokarnense]MCW2305832.1 tripartite-type tricarboxylate transporter receptor subunit TctC [Rhodobium gokarnense]
MSFVDRIAHGTRCLVSAALFALPLAAAPVLASSGAEAADDFPSRPVNLVVSYGAGGGTDRQARMMAGFLEKKLGSSVVVQNMPGAGGQVAITAMLREEPDGYTIVATNEPDISMTVALRNAPYAREDVEVLAVDIVDPRLLLVQKDAPYETFDDFVKAAKENPGELSVAVNSGAVQEQFAKWLFKALDVDINFVGYKSGGETTAALLGGHVTSLVGDDFARFDVRDQTKALMIGSATGSPRWPEAKIMVDALKPYGVTPPTPDFLARHMVYMVPSALHEKYPARFQKLQDAITSLATDPEYQKLIKDQGAGDLTKMAPGSDYRDAFQKSLEALKATVAN